MNTKRVADLMTRDVAVINRKSDVHELEKLLLEKRVHGLPVVNDEGILVGVISQTDLTTPPGCTSPMRPRWPACSSPTSRQRQSRK